LVVVAILAILAAIAIPQYNKYRANAMLSNVQTLVKSIATQAASLATTAGQNPACTNYSEFAVGYDSSNYMLVAYPYNGTNVNTSVVCDKVKIFTANKPTWVNSVSVADISGSGSYLYLKNTGTDVEINGTVIVKSNYALGSKHIGCKYYPENGTMEDAGNNYVCKTF